LNYNL